MRHVANLFTLTPPWWLPLDRRRSMRESVSQWREDSAPQPRASTAATCVTWAMRPSAPRSSPPSLSRWVSVRGSRWCYYLASLSGCANIKLSRLIPLTDDHICNTDTNIVWRQSLCHIGKLRQTWFVIRSNFGKNINCIYFSLSLDSNFFSSLYKAFLLSFLFTSWASLFVATKYTLLFTAYF